jgi:hypothetical protein
VTLTALHGTWNQAVLLLLLLLIRLEVVFQT